MWRCSESIIREEQQMHFSCERGRYIPLWTFDRMAEYTRGDNRKNSDIDIMILVDLQDEQMEALSDVLSEHDFAENGTKEDLVMHRLAVAGEDLDTAYILLDLKKYRGANNRAY